MMNFYKDKMLRPAKQAISRIELKIAEKCLSYGIKKNPEFFNAKVADVVNMVAKKYIDQEMRKEGIKHCEITGCLKRFPLRYFGKSLVCKDHYEILSKTEKGGAA